MKPKWIHWKLCYTAHQLEWVSQIELISSKEVRYMVVKCLRGS